MTKNAGAREFKAGGAWQNHDAEYNTEVFQILFLGNTGKGVTKERRKIKKDLREMKSFTPSLFQGPEQAAKLGSSLNNQEMGLHKGRRIWINQIA